MGLSLEASTIKTKVLHLIASHKIGGAERLLIAFAQAVDLNRFDVVLGIFVRPDHENDLLWQEAKKLKIPLEPVVIRSAFDFNQLHDIYAIIKKHKPDVIHTHGYKTNILAFLFAKLFNIKAVSTVHGGLHAERLITRFLYWVNLQCLRRFDKIIAVSDAVKSGLEKCGIGADKITVIKNIPAVSSCRSPVTTSARSKLGIPPQAKLVGFIGRLEKVKGGAQFIDAALSALETRSDLYFIIIGDGSQKAVLEESVAKSGHSAHFRFAGFISDPTEVFSSLDLYVLSSLDEGIPLTVLEAMCLGVPVIATRVGGVPEVISDGINGILLPPDDAPAMAAAISNILTDDTVRNSMVSRAKKDIAAKYDVGTWIAKIESLYESGAQSRLHG
ncbi:glycosyltransferase [Geotalea daltonii FRC-32]|uniref:Glycosyltransferase n=1 Tax=Geotalea daltonii (strain DSM 22248 / JCM 15807 / FRC-32) TaxID=316067 RepID=B9M2W2_GEODF|nr:glycosyltransferase [Geotalea daltonii]ACM21308.1 glycosyltransferase [Geotalea daltonii FRC-32]